MKLLPPAFALGSFSEGKPKFSYIYIHLAKFKHMWFVYFLRYALDSIYTGCTTDITRRIDEHNSHKVHFTKDKTPVSLISYVVFLINN